MIGPEVHQLTAEFTTIVTEEPRRYSSVDLEPIQQGDDILATKTLAHLDSQTLSRKHIDHGEGAKPPTIRQLVSDKVQSPCFIRACQRGPVRLGHRRFPPPGKPVAEYQAFLPVETIHEFLAHGPPFTIEQHENLPVAVPDPRLGHLPDPLPERSAGISMTLIMLGDPRTANGYAMHRYATTIASARALEFV